jgi:hypothetical protein
MITKEKQADRQRRAWAKRHDEVPEVDRQLDQYDKAKRRTAWSLVIFLVANFAVIGAYESRSGAIIFWCLFATLVVSGVVAYLSNGQMAERRGYCLGKYGKTPAELDADDELDDEEDLDST